MARRGLPATKTVGALGIIEGTIRGGLRVFGIGRGLVKLAQDRAAARAEGQQAQTQPEGPSGERQ